LPCESDVSEIVTWHVYVWPSLVLHADCVGSSSCGVTANIGGLFGVGDGDGLGVGDGDGDGLGDGVGCTHVQVTYAGCSFSSPVNVKVSLWHGMLEIVT